MKTTINKYEKQEQVESGVKLIAKIIKKTKGTKLKKTLEELTQSQKLLEKKAKMLANDKELVSQYADRTAFDTIQGVFQAFHVYIISDCGDELIQETIDWLRTYENCYSIADRIQKAAEKRADFNGAPKKI